MSEKTRRDWLITISRAAAATSLVEQLKGGPDQTAVPPPGVYGPSTDHLSHALMSTERYRPILPGCPTEYVEPSAGPYHPQFFSRAEYPILRRLVGVILGESSGQPEGVAEAAEWIDLRVSGSNEVRKAAAQLDSMRRALAVAHYGAKRVDRLATEDPVKICREGLVWMGAHSEDFLALSTSDQATIVKMMSEAKTDTAEGAFFAFLKTEAIKGFYTSQTGLKELDYKGNTFYARSPGCWT